MELSLIGLQNAGKTSLVNVIASGAFHEDMIPTVGFNMRKVTRGAVTIKLWDLGGQVIPKKAPVQPMCLQPPLCRLAAPAMLFRSQGVTLPCLCLPMYQHGSPSYSCLLIGPQEDKHIPADSPRLTVSKAQPCLRSKETGSARKCRPP